MAFFRTGAPPFVPPLFSVIPTWAEFRAEHLPVLMRDPTIKGRKRLRKKKALKLLRTRYAFLRMLQPLVRRVNYAEIGRTLFVVEPMHPPTGAPFYMD